MPKTFDVSSMNPDQLVSQLKSRKTTRSKGFPAAPPPPEPTTAPPVRLPRSTYDFTLGRNEEAAMDEWAQRRGLQLNPAAMVAISTSKPPGSSQVGGLLRDAAGPSRGTSNIPAFDPLFLPNSTNADIFLFGEVPTLYFERVTTTLTPSSFYSAPGGGVLLREQGWEDEWGRHRVRGSLTSTWWWGIDGFGKARTCISASDLFLTNRDFVGQVAPSPNTPFGWWKRLGRACFNTSLPGFGRAARTIRSSILTVDPKANPSVLSLAVGLPGHYPGPPTQNISGLITEADLVRWASEGRMEVVGLQPRTRTSVGDITGFRVWPVKGAGTEYNPWVFMFVGKNVKAACPLKLYRDLAGPPPRSAQDRCAPTTWAERHGLTLFTSVAGVVTTVAGSPALSMMANAMTGAVNKGGLGAAGFLAKQVGTFALAEAGQSFEGAQEFVDEMGSTLSTLDGTELADIATAGSRSAQSFIESGYAVYGKATPKLQDLITSAKNKGVSETAARIAVGTQADQIRRVSVFALNPQTPADWARASNTFVTGLGDDINQGRVFLGDNASYTIASLQHLKDQGTPSPLVNDPSVLEAATLMRRPDEFGSSPADRLVVIGGGTRSFLESAAFENATETVVQSYTAQRKAGPGIKVKKLFFVPPKEAQIAEDDSDAYLSSAKTSKVEKTRKTSMAAALGTGALLALKFFL